MYRDVLAKGVREEFSDGEKEALPLVAQKFILQHLALNGAHGNTN